MIFLFTRRYAELKVVGITLGVLILLPVIALVVFTSSGLAIIGSALVQVNPASKLVSIFNPTGQKIAELQVVSTWPARGYVSDEFGTYSGFRGNTGVHNGIDIANHSGKPGDPVTPFMSGTVLKVHAADDNICGRYVQIDNGSHITSLYCHLAQVTAETGAAVVPGQIIGRMGSSGFATGVHVHLGIYVYGIAVNPRLFLSGEPESDI